MSNQPLASLIRPKDLSSYIGQRHLLGDGKPLKLAFDQKLLFSMIFWGPPGVGKTTLARILANNVGAQIYELSAVSAGKDDIRKIVSDNRPTLVKKVLFLDEIHRFNKAQQDYLLPYVESGALTLIGATTENPSFEIISPLLSRCRVFTLSSLSDQEMEKIIKLSAKTLKTRIAPSAVNWLIKMANGDARQAITMLDNAHTLYQSLSIDSLKNTLQNSHLRFDKKGEEHYNTISALIKSMRASNPDAAIYYLTRLIESGEDPKFIARRLVIFASEDIGLANSNALLIANQVFRAVEIIGYPECAINLSHAVAYLSLCAKDRSSYDALRSAQSDVRETGNLSIPLELRNAPTKFMKEQGYGKDYQMYSKKDLLPDKLKGTKYFNNLTKNDKTK